MASTQSALHIGSMAAWLPWTPAKEALEVLARLLFPRQAGDRLREKFEPGRGATTHFALPVSGAAS